MSSIFGYFISNLIAETNNSKVYHVKKDNKKYILKVLKKKFPTASEIARFKKEFNLLTQFKDINVVTPIKFIDTSEGFAILEEDFNAISLKNYIENKLTIKQFLKIGIAVSRILGQLHKNKIIHKDIKPGNILINDTDNIIKLADFGIAVFSNSINENIFTPDAIQGSLVYISPEQTGRMNRDIDYRTDLYSLGITFYEMLLNKVPFSSEDPLEIIHSHIARIPRPVSEINQEIPEMISKIIDKLLAKTAEERYQNAFGLMFDLENCLKQLESKGKILPFPLAKKDVSLRFSIPQVLVGRKKEVKKLLGLFDRFCNGEKNSVLVVGNPGIGKSAIINEIQKPIVEKRGFFITGKYDQLRKDSPYSGIIMAFQFLIKLILTKRSDQLQVYKEQLLTALGTNGKIITDIIPDVSILIGEQPPVEKLGHDESLNRFNFVFKNFVNIFATSEHPLVLFVDDLQWMDMSSISLLQYLVTDAEIHHLFFIGAYRDNEVTEDHPLNGFIDEIKKEKVKINYLNVNPITEENIYELLTNVFIDRNQKIHDLSKLIFRKTEGNPFFVIQFIRNLYDEGQIKTDSEKGWTWDIDQIKALQVSDNVVEMMVQKINKLPENSSKILKICACIGNRFDLEVLSESADIPIEKILNDLTPAIEIGLIREIEGIYKFHHDRIEEAAYSMMSEEYKINLHHKIGSIVLKKVKDEDLESKIFYITHHLNKAITLIESTNKRIKLAELNKIAGNRAHAASSFDIALSFYDTGINLLPDDSWQSNYELTFSLYLKFAESNYITGNPKRASKLFKMIINKAKNKIDKANVYSIWIVLLHSMEELDKALDYGQKAYKLFNLRYNKKPSFLSVIGNIIHFKYYMKKVPPEKIVNYKVAEKNEGKMIANLFFSVASVASIYNKNLHVILLLQAYKIIPRVGNSKYTTSLLIMIGTVFIVGLNDYKIGKRFLDAAKISRDKFNAGKDIFPFYVQEYFISHWFYPLRNGIKNFRNAHNEFRNNGNLIFANHCISTLMHFSIVAGRNLEETFNEFNKYKNFIFKLKDPSAEGHYSDHFRFYENLIGKTDSIHTLNKSDSFEENAIIHLEKTSKLGNFLYYAMKSRLEYIYGDYKNAYIHSTMMQDWIMELKGTIQDSENYFLHSIIISSYYDEASSKEKKKILKQLNKNEKKLRQFNEYCPENFSHKLFLIRAEIKRIKSEFREAEKLYLESIKLAGEQQFLHNEAFASEMLMKLYIKIGDQKNAKDYFKKTSYLFSRWGAIAKVDYLKEQYPDLVTEIFEESTTENKNIMTNTFTSTATMSIDLSTSLKASQAISREIVLPELIKKIMLIVMENAGGQKGLLLLETNGTFTIEGRSTVDSDEVIVLESTLVEESDEVPLSVIQFVNRKAEYILLDNAVTDDLYSSDEYIKNNKIKSILCLPVLNQGKVSGILYLENNLITNAFTPDRIELLSLISSQAAVSIDNARLYANLEEKVEERTIELRNTRDALWGEMQVAKKIQSSLLPKKPIIEGYEIAAYMNPADDVGGDYYDIINYKEHDWIIIGDVSGHGVPAGLIMMMVQTSIHTILDENPNRNPSELLALINRTIRKNIENLKEDKYMTITVFAVSKNGMFTFSGLHQNIFIYRKETRSVEIKATDGMWIGIFNDISDKLVDETFKLNVDDVLLLHTDGITEAWRKGTTKGKRDIMNDMYQEERLMEFFKNLGDSSPEEIKNGILETLEDFELDDDVTLVVVKRLE